MLATKNYTARIDTKKRITLRGARYPFYRVREYSNGCITLEPQELVSVAEISAKTLADMDKAVANLKSGEVSEAIDFSVFEGK